MNQSRKNLNSHRKYIFLIILVAFLVLIPFFIKPYQAEHDTKYHLANVAVMKEQIQRKKISSPILDKIGYGLGYGTHLFYPPLAHTTTTYIALVLEKLDLTLTDSFKFTHFLALALSGITMYFLSYRLSKDKKIAFFSGIIYMIFPYHLSDIYVRDSLAECYLFVFLPLIFSGIYELLEQNSKKFYPLFILGYVGGILSHFTLMIYFTILLLIFLFVSRKKVLKKEFLVPFSIATLIALLITSFFLVGLIENKIIGDYVVFEQGEMTKRVSKTALYPFEYLNIFPFLQSEIKFYYPVIILALIVFTYLNRKNIKPFKYSKNFLYFGLVAFFLSTKIFPWKIVPYFFQMVQFPWRFQIFVGLIISLFAPLCILKLNPQKVRIVLILLLLSPYWVINIPNKEIIDQNNIWYNGGMGWQKEYLPIIAKKNKDYLKKKKQTISFIDGTGSYQILENDMPTLTFILDISKNASIELPRIYYPGYELVLENNEKIPVRMSKYGLLEANGLESGTYHLEYKETPLRRIARKVSIITVVISIVIYLYNIRKKNRI